jgi:hypothetical protein
MILNKFGNTNKFWELKTANGRLFLFAFSFFLLPFTFSHAQVIYEPINLPIYNFLDRQNIEGVITLDSEAKPFSRVYIAQKLFEINENKNSLSSVEKENLEWFFEEYAYELNKLAENNSELRTEDWQLQTENGFISMNPRIQLYQFYNENFQLKISPVMGYGISSTGGKSGHHRRIGIRAISTIDDWFGASLHMTDNGQFGDNVDRNKIFTPIRGADEISAPNGIEFSDVRAQINLNWDWGTISLKKDYNEWGNSYFGNVILSDKAPSFTHIHLQIKPTEWFRFNYMYGWLHSGVIDSSSRILNNADTQFPVYFEEFVPKYFVSNLFTFTPVDWLDFSLGNFAIYAGDVRPEMFIPFGFYKYFDRDSGKKSTQDSNGGLHFDLAVRYPKSFKFYTSFFVDVTSIRALLNADPHETWVGYTFGGKKVNLILENLDLTLEYTRLNPWIYEHKYELTSYKHLDYLLGHWIGQNSDQFRVQIDYQLLRGLYFNLSYEQVRIGGLDDISFAYDGEVEEFLYGEIRKQNTIGLEVNYEIFHECFTQLVYSISDITDENKTRTLPFQLGNKNHFSFGLYYGIP